MWTFFRNFRYRCTMSYVSILCRTYAYNVVRQHTISHTICNMLETAWALRGSQGSHREERAGFLALMFEASEARSFVILDVLEGLKENMVAWTDSTRDQRAACIGRLACVHVARWRFAAQLRAGEGCIHVMLFFTGAGRAIISCTTG